MNKTFYREELFHENSEQLFVDFKYNGGSDSLVYEYVSGPIAEKGVSVMPLWLAPNLITFVSFLLGLTPNVVLFASQGFEIGRVVPSYVNFVAAFCYLVYNFLDNVDGKQARRTGSSSVLGMIFDHGCDSFMSPMICITIAYVAQLRIGFTLALVVGGIVFFLLVQLEGAALGQMRLPRINPVDEGIPLICGILFIFGVLGNETFASPLGESGFVLSDLLAILFLVPSLISFLVEIYKLIRAQGFLWLLSAVLPMLLHLLIAIPLAIRSGFSNSNLMLACIYFGLISSRVIVDRMLLNVTKTFPRPLLGFPLAFDIVFTVSFLIFGTQEVLIVFVIIAALYLIIFASCLARRLAYILGIKVFSIRSTADQIGLTKPQAATKEHYEIDGKLPNFETVDPHNPDKLQIQSNLW